MLLDLFAYVFGAFGAILYIGFFAYKIGAPPLIVISICCMIPMVVAFYVDFRHEREVARVRGEHERK